MSEWKSDLEFGNKVCSQIIPELEKRFGCKIRQTIHGGEADIELSTDLIVEFPDRTESWAVKFRREDKKIFNDVTVEFMNGTGKKGDWFRFKGGIVQKYVYGFSNGETTYSIIDIKRMMEIPESEWKYKQNREHGLASFKAISYKELIKKNAFIK